VSEESLAKIASEPDGGEQKAKDLKEYIEILKELDDKIDDVEKNISEMAATPETHSMSAVSNMIQVCPHS
jgi:hypothetical protein